MPLNIPDLFHSPLSSLFLKHFLLDFTLHGSHLCFFFTDLLKVFLKFTSCPRNYVKTKYRFKKNSLEWYLLVFCEEWFHSNFIPLSDPAMINASPHAYYPRPYPCTWISGHRNLTLIQTYTHCFIELNWKCNLRNLWIFEALKLRVGLFYPNIIFNETFPHAMHRSGMHPEIVPYIWTIRGIFQVKLLIHTHVFVSSFALSWSLFLL